MVNFWNRRVFVSKRDQKGWNQQIERDHSYLGRVAEQSMAHSLETEASPMESFHKSNPGTRQLS